MALGLICVNARESAPSHLAGSVMLSPILRHVDPYHAAPANHGVAQDQFESQRNLIEAQQ